MRLKEALFVLLGVGVFTADAATVTFGGGASIGAGLLFDGLGVYERFDFHLTVNRFRTQIRAINMAEANSRPVDSPMEQFIEVGLLAGVVFPLEKYLRCSFTGGLSFVYATERVYMDSYSVHQYVSQYKAVEYKTVGVPLQVDFYFLPANFFGTGVQIAANINAPNPCAGISLGFVFGRLK